MLSLPRDLNKDKRTMRGRSVNPQRNLGPIAEESQWFKEKEDGTRARRERTLG